MKNLLHPLLFLLSALAALGQTTNVTFIWNMPTNQPFTGLTYYLYGTAQVQAQTNQLGVITNLVPVLPTNQWPLVATITNPTVTSSGTNLAYSVAIVPGAWFFTMQAGNQWGLSPFSQAAETRPLLGPQFNNLQILLGPAP